MSSEVLVAVGIGLGVGYVAGGVMGWASGASCASRARR